MLSIFPKVPVGSDDACRHLHNDLLALLRFILPWPQFGIFVVFVVKRQHRYHPSSLFLIQNELGPRLSAHLYATHEPVRPVVAAAHAIVIIEQDRQIHVPLVKRCGDPIPVPQSRAYFYARYNRLPYQANLLKSTQLIPST